MNGCLNKLFTVFDHAYWLTQIYMNPVNYVYHHSVYVHGKSRKSM